MAEANNKSVKKLIDVSPPSSVIQPANSKSIIIGHSPMVRDSTIIEDNQNDNQSEPTNESATHHLKISPLTDQLSSNDQTSPDKQPNSILEEPRELKLEPSESLKKEISANENQIEPEKVSPKVEGVDLATDQPEIKTTTQSVDGQPDKVDSLEKPQDNQDQQAELNASLAKQAHLNELIASKKFFLPINGKEKSKNKKTILIGLLICLVLIIAWVDVDLDAGLIANTYNLPHPHFFTLNR